MSERPASSDTLSMPRIVVEMRHLQPLYELLAHRPQLIAELEARGLLMRVEANDVRCMPEGLSLELSAFLQSQGERHVSARLAAAVDLSAGEGLLYFARSSDTLREMLAELLQHQADWLPGATLKLEEDASTVCIGLMPTMSVPPQGLLLYWEGTLTWLRRALNFALGQAPTVLEARVMTPASPQPEVLAALLGCAVQFDADCFVLCLPRDWLDRPLPGRHAALRQGTAVCFEALGQRQRSAQPRWRQVLEVIEATPCADELSLASVSARLDLPPSTLRRHLANEGQRFSALVDAHRREQAFEQLVLQDGRLEAQARTLGYAGRAPLARAFRAWFAASPTQLRQDFLALQALNADEDWASPLRLPAFEVPAAGSCAGDVGAMLRADPVLWAHTFGRAAQARSGARLLRPQRSSGPDDDWVQQLGAARVKDGLQARRWMHRSTPVVPALQSRWRRLQALLSEVQAHAPTSPTMQALLAWSELGALLLLRVEGEPYADFRTAWQARGASVQWAEERRRYGVDRLALSHLLMAAWGVPAELLAAWARIRACCAEGGKGADADTGENVGEGEGEGEGMAGPRAGDGWALLYECRVVAGLLTMDAAPSDWRAWLNERGWPAGAAS